MKKIRVLLVDDHAVLRAGLGLLLNGQADMEVCGQAEDAREAVAACANLRPDVAVVDLSLPAGGGIRAIGQIRHDRSAGGILVLSMHQDAAYVRAALAAGALGYVTKGSADTALLAGIRAVSRQQAFIDPALATAVAPEFLTSGAPAAAESQASPDPLDRLSRRERQALDLLVQGLTNQQAADHLGLSVKTIETYRARLGKKLGLRTRADFVRYGLESGLLAAGQIGAAAPLEVPEIKDESGLANPD